jgi:hypothetical protein
VSTERKPYLEAWLRRTGKELSASGRLSEIALILSQKKGGDPSEWVDRIRRILARLDEPSFELLTEIDSLLVRPTKQKCPEVPDADLFD